MKISELSVHQKDILTILENSYEKNKLVHAYLFEGNAGSGTFEMAMYMAMKLLCQDRHNKPCMHCNSCNRILNNSHLNVLVIEPIDDMIRKEQIEELITEFSMTSLETGPKVAIVKDIDKINNAGGNTLLKFLEEPEKNIIGFLITENKDKLLSTVVSRCQLYQDINHNITFINDEIKKLSNQYFELFNLNNNELLLANKATAVALKDKETASHFFNLLLKRYIEKYKKDGRVS